MDKFSDLIDFLKVEGASAKGIKIKVFLFLFRLANFYCKGKTGFRFVLFPFFLIYKIYSEFLVGIDISASSNIGKGLRVYHGYGLVVHPKVILGKNCILRHGVTIGNKGGEDAINFVPVIGDNVDFGAGSIVIGNIKIGDSVKIGAGTVVTKSIPAGSVVVGAGIRVIDA